MSCFQIAHSIQAHDLFTVIERKGYKYLRAKPKHFICEDLKEQYEKESPTQAPVSRGRGRPSKTNDEDDNMSNISSSSSDSTVSAPSVSLHERIAHGRRTRAQARKTVRPPPTVQTPKKRAKRAVIDRRRHSSRNRK